MTAFDVDFYRRLLECSPEGVVLVDAQNPEHPVVYANPGFETLTGYSGVDLIGKNLANRTPGIGSARRSPRANPAASCCAITARMGRSSGTR